MELGLHFGALTPLISEQIKKQLNYTDETILSFDKDADALVRVYLSNIITDEENAKARQRLMKKITKHLNTIKKGR